MKRSERGFTLIEILLVVAITALIGSAAVMATFQVINGTKRSNDHMTAIQQVQNAGYWISHDALMAQGVVVDDDPETAEFLILTWTEWGYDEDSTYHSVTYSFEDMADGLKQLKRQYLIYVGEDVEKDETIVVAEYIDSEESFFEPEQDGVWKLTIKACLGTQTETGEYEITETREYEINPRVNI